MKNYILKNKVWKRKKFGIRSEVHKKWNKAFMFKFFIFRRKGQNIYPEKSQKKNDFSDDDPSSSESLEREASLKSFMMNKLKKRGVILSASLFNRETKAEGKKSSLKWSWSQPKAGYRKLSMKLLGLRGNMRICSSRIREMLVSFVVKKKKSSNLRTFIPEE